MVRVAPSEAMLEELESSVHCERCKGIASYIVRHKTRCDNAAEVPPPYEYTMCEPCMRRFGVAIDRGQVLCAACNQNMDKMTHTISEIERL